MHVFPKDLACLNINHNVLKYLIYVYFLFFYLTRFFFTFTTITDNPPSRYFHLQFDSIHCYIIRVECGKTIIVSFIDHHLTMSIAAHPKNVKSV